MSDLTRPPEVAGQTAQRISEITLDEHTVLRRSAVIEQERAAAIADLLKDNQFNPLSGRTGPFHLHLAIHDNRLAIDLGNPAEGSIETIMVPIDPFRRIVKDYFMVCESHYDAIRSKSFAQVEAIDMGRRSLHDEGATLLIERLADKVTIDHDTARRLFTLICVLHLRA